MMGSRSINDYSVVAKAIRKSGYKITNMVSGTDMGVMELGKAWAAKHEIPIEEVPLDTSQGNMAELMQTQDIIACSDAVIAVWDGKSRRTAYAMELAYFTGKSVFLAVVVPNEGQDKPLVLY